MSLKYASISLVTLAVFVILAIAVIPYVDGKQGFYCEQEEIDLNSGTIRIRTFFVGFKVNETSKPNPLLKYMDKDEGNRSNPNWKRVNTFGLFRRVSPHYKYHGTVSRLRSLNMIFENQKLSLERRKEITKQYLLLLKKEDLDGMEEMQTALIKGKQTLCHQGLFHDEETSLVYNRARMLHPRLGRFMQRDPLEYVDGANLYQYVVSNPVALTDPLGLAPVTNNSDVPIPYKPEHADDVRLATPGETVDADAVYSPFGTKDPIIVKVPGNTSSEVRPDGSLAVNAGVLGNIDYFIALPVFDERFVPRVVTPEDLEAPGRETNFPNPYTGRNWPFARWELPDDSESNSDDQIDGDECE